MLKNLRPFLVLLFLFTFSTSALCATFGQGKPASSAWAEVDRLTSEQKYQAALDAALKVLASARARKDERLETESIIKATQLEMGLHGYESAVKFLRDTPWPKDSAGRVLLHLYYARSLVYYQEMYSWEINQREQQQSGAPEKLDLKSWTTAQIGRQAALAFDSAMAESSGLDAPVPGFFRMVLSPNTYPAGVRPVLRDAVVYLAVQLLANQQFWSARESNEVYKLPIAKLAALDQARRIPAASEKAHPLEKAASWLGEHSAYHMSKSRSEAALEARYSLLELLHGSVAEEGDRAMIREALRGLQKNAARVAWWARGQALLAEFLRVRVEPGTLIEARKEALAGRDAFPASVGGELCARVLFEIEQPEFQLRGMESDAADKRSLLLEYRNIRKIHFRAYKLNVDESLKGTKGNTFAQLDHLKLKALVATKALHAWSSELTETKDYTQHRRFITPPGLKTGVYAVLASLDPDFRENSNVVQGVRLNVTNLVLSVRNAVSDTLEVRALSGESGKPIEGAMISLHRFNWQGASPVVKELTTDANGYALLEDPGRKKQTGHWNYFITARSGENFAIHQGGIGFGRESSVNYVSQAFVYTDRAIYRPQQKLHFKVLGYSGVPEAGKYTAAKAGEFITVQLLDPNYQIVATSQVKLGRFGSGSGEFLIPAGRPLGDWQVQASNYSGMARVLVEEYKRPTFEPTLKEAGELRLNRAVKIAGEARYYFGLPVTAGTVRWRVTREKIMPWWWGYYGRWNPGGNKAAETVANGSSELQSTGAFEIVFTPQADERSAVDKDATYRFRIEADVTDEGGETRTASRSYRLGFVAVEAKLDWEQGFFRTGQAAKIQANLSDLDGKPLKGSGTWKVLRLSGKTMLPSELELDPAESSARGEKGQYAHEDDKKRARWETQFRWDSLTRKWQEGEMLAQGKVEHDEKGEGVISLNPFERSGVYRLSYSTKDSFGAVFEVSRDFVVGAPKPELPLPLLVLANAQVLKVGETARFLVHSGLEEQPLTIEVFRAGKRLSRKTIVAGTGAELLEIPVTNEDRGGFTVLVTGLRDHQSLSAEASVQVPWSDKELKLEFSTFRDKLSPGQKETFRITVKSEKGQPVEAGGAEVLAYMYDRSLDLFGEHQYPQVASLYPTRTGAPGLQLTLGTAPTYSLYHNLPHGPNRPYFIGDTLELHANYGIGGPGRRGGFSRHDFAGSKGMAMMESAMDSSAGGGGMARAKGNAPLAVPAAASAREQSAENEQAGGPKSPQKDSAAPPSLRTNFSEQAFFAPHLVTGPGGSLAVEFTAPESVTSWRVLAHAVTSDLRGGSVSRETRTVKELMVRPYIPRFLREGDEAEIKVQVNNASEGSLSGELNFEIENLTTGKSALKEFGLSGPQVKSFKVSKNGSTTLGFAVKAPKTVGDYAFKVVAKAKNFSDGERRPFPMLPSRLHLAQSRFVTLHQKDKKTLEFKDLAAKDDPTLINDRLVVTVDAQLFYGVLQALPYLVQYPYECVEQTLNRFLATGIVSSLFDKYPSVGKMAKEFSSRKTRLEAFGEQQDSNRRMSLEETPWLQDAKGGPAGDDPLVNVLNPEAARTARDVGIAKLKKMQLSTGAFPWFQGGPPDEHMTLYVLLGLARALEFKVNVPKEITENGWRFVRGWLDTRLSEMISKDYGWEIVTLVNFALSSYPDESWTGGHFDQAYRNKLLDFSFKHWKNHSPLVKGYLALTLKRMGRAKDATLVWHSVMDSAKHNEELGTFWAREDRSWLWYNDQIESHAFALRTQMELDEKNKHNEGIVQWLFLNKKLNHWKSTRATSEVIYALAHYLDRTSQLGQREAVKVQVGNQTTEFTFNPEKYTGKKNQIVVPGEKIDPATHARTTVSKETPGIAFASATWHFSTEKLPKEASGDFFQVTRKFFRRENTGGEWKLVPLAAGEKIRVGDQLEVQLSLRAKHEAEYVHLRDPRGAGFEPETLNSGYKWDLGIFWYEETRDSGSNFFFNRLPVGEYTFKYRLRANMAGVFRVGPATVQSMYAPEFNAYSEGNSLSVEPARN